MKRVRISKRELMKEASLRIGFDMEKRYPWIFSYYAKQSRQNELLMARSLTDDEAKRFMAWLFG